MQRRRVVDAVAEEPDHVSRLAQRDNDALLLVGLYLGENVNVRSRGLKRGIGQCRQFRPAHHDRLRLAHLAAQRAGDRCRIACDDLERDTEVPQVLHGHVRVFFRRVEQHHQPLEDHVVFVLTRDACESGFVSGGHAQGSQSLFRIGLHLLGDARRDLRDVADTAVVQAAALGDLEHGVHRPLGHHQWCAVLDRQYREPLAKEVVRNLVELGPAECQIVGDATDSLVDGVHEPGLHRRVQCCLEQHVARIVAVDVHGRFHVDHALGQGPCLVRAQNVHAPKVLDGVQPLDDHLLVRHLASAVRKVDADDRRQQLGRESHRECEREEERLEDRTLQEDVDGKDADDEHQRHFEEQVAESPDAPLEVGLGGSLAQMLADRPELGGDSRVHHERRGHAAHHVGAHPYAVGPAVERRARQ